MSNTDLVFAIGGMLGVPAVIAGIILFWLSRRMNRMDTNTACRKEENILILRGLFTIGGLAHATAEALKEGYANGHVSDAMGEYVDYKTDLKAYLIEQSADKNTNQRK